MNQTQEQTDRIHGLGTQRNDSSTKGRKRTFNSNEQPSTHKRPREEGRVLSENIEGTPRRSAQWVQSRAASSPNTPQRSAGPTERLLGGTAVKASGLAGQTPLRLKETSQLLPSSHALLVDMFGKLQTVYLLYKRRQQRCTFQNAKKPVEESCGRLFTMEHLLQLKEVVPEALQLSRSAVARAAQTPGSALKPEAQVLIEMPLLAAAGGTLQDLRQLLADRLLERVRNHFQHVGGGQIGERDLETVPEVPQAELPAAAEVLTSLPAGGSPAVPSPATPATGAVRPTPRSSLRKPPTAPPTARAMAKRLSFGGLQPVRPAEAGGAAGRSEPAAWGASLLDDDDPRAAITGGLAKKMRRESMDGTLPVSLQALQAVQQHAGEQAAALSTEAVAARKQSIAAASLTKTFDALRALFGPAGPAVRPHTQVVRDLLGPRAGDEQQQELDGQIDLLLEIVPEYLIREVREQGPVLRINRSLDAKAVREKLVNHILDSTCT